MFSLSSCCNTCGSDAVLRSCKYCEGAHYCSEECSVADFSHLPLVKHDKKEVTSERVRILANKALQSIKIIPSGYIMALNINFSGRTLSEPSGILVPAFASTGEEGPENMYKKACALETESGTRKLIVFANIKKNHVICMGYRYFGVFIYTLKQNESSELS